jgi:hypothetical protein
MLVPRDTPPARGRGRHARVVTFLGSTRTETKETSPLEKGVVEHKYYCPDAGVVLIKDLKGKTVPSGSPGLMARSLFSPTARPGR